ncbi:glycerol-3-phosphate 1-O-acyltransferase PlsY [Robertmurraya kyonggiensis]|uniref:Glycerol-3-phosphate acyltransferase n=1 Tax=Robertmurraya kyonggiensis TaxID=1037680 RepID=A0A4U1DB33_9BACI|nr:glycerol-3-phosphate 1-O-acyltransferase PlsY [Robertmurraya kyonggiensis]TKC19253.1 glycerol-3-phosphate 1-O-acyltransferase PlsY [Robertmurraya kyonggiensis]
MISIGIIILAYLLGSIPSGLIAGKARGIDIRQHGSGNLGATNTFRVLGVKAGIIVTLVDILKGTLATLLPFLLHQTDETHALVAGLAAVVGHMFPIFASFKGGKAVATSGGVLLGYVPLMFLVIVVVFLISLYITKYVSFSSIIAALTAFLYAIVFGGGDIPLIIVATLLAGFVIYRHRANIVRIKNKTEPKIKWL